MAKRVLIYTNHFFPENFKVNEIASLFFNEGMDVTVITGIPNYPEGKIAQGYGYFKRRRELVNGVLVKRLWLIPRGSGSKIRLVINYLSYFVSCLFYTLYIAIFKKRFEVVFVHHTSPILIAIPPIVYKWLRKPKMILWDLDMWPDTLVALDVLKPGKLVSYLEKLVKWIYKNYDTILIGSKSFAEKAKLRVEASKVDYFPNWAETIFIEGKHVEPSNKPIFPDGFKIMYTGNIGEAQDFGTVFKTMELVKDDAIYWLIVGGGRWLTQLKDKVVAAGLTDKVLFYGNNPLESMPYFFSKADVMFFSLQDKAIFSKTVPAKLQAYMVSGNPIIGMISGEGNAIIKEANCGIAVSSGDFNAFAEAIMKMYSNQETLHSMGRQGKDYYTLHFSMDARRTQLLRIIND